MKTTKKCPCAQLKCVQSAGTVVVRGKPMHTIAHLQCVACGRITGAGKVAGRVSRATRRPVQEGLFAKFIGVCTGKRNYA